MLSDILIETKKSTLLASYVAPEPSTKLSSTEKKDREDSDVSPRGNQELKRKNIIQLSSVAVTVNPDTEGKWITLVKLSTRLTKLGLK